MRKLALLPFVCLVVSAMAQDPFIGTQVRITVDNASNSANETTGAASADGREIVAGFNDYRSGGLIRTGVPVSSDGGQTWSHLIVRPPTQNQTSVEGDPMTAYDRRTNTLWVGAIAFGGSGGIFVARKNPGQNSFAPSVMARVNSGADKCWMEAGPRPGLPNTTRLYITYNEGVIRSDDLGTTWTTPLSLGSGIGFLPRVGPNGELYVTYWDFGTGVMFRRSLDGGQTFSTAVRAATRLDTWGTEFNNGRVPGDYRIPPIHGMDVNPVDGSITIVYCDTTNTIGSNRNLDLWMTRSTNQGTSWSTPTRLPFRDLTQLGDMFFPWIEYSQDGRLHLLSFNSQYTVQNDGGSDGFLDQDYAYSDNNGATWRRFRLTPNSFNSRNDGRPSAPAFMGDYSGIAVADKVVYPIYLSTQLGKSVGFTNIVSNTAVLPTAFSFFRGTRASGGLESLFFRDSDSLVGQVGLVLNQQEAPIQLDVTAAGVVNTNPSQLRVTVWGRVNTPSIRQQLLMFNINTSQYDLIDTRNASQTETLSDIVVPNPSSYITPGSGTVRARLAYSAIGPVTQPGWQAQFNLVNLQIVP
ncbi:MAG: exo-alpha-sialidase [Fimbriimonadaceae bacterium]|nr:exo-alpha-sialidase [Fimbriimonadaceae bacterium]QYK58515.1 MAG: exo-alpha-sialidase [Fimbriimonadaceae bacterium]